MTDFRSMCRGLNLKSTPKRLAILAILDSERVYLSPEEIWRRMKERFNSIGLPTVYRNLEDLHGGGVISRVIHPNRQLYYYLCRNGDHHHHFICMSCRKVEDIGFCAEKEIEEIVTSTIKGKMLSHILQIDGICNRCLRRGEAAHGY